MMRVEELPPRGGDIHPHGKDKSSVLTLQMVLIVTRVDRISIKPSTVRAKATALSFCMIKQKSKKPLYKTYLFSFVR
jgi:hypothetical protein